MAEALGWFWNFNKTFKVGWKIWSIDVFVFNYGTLKFWGSSLDWKKNSSINNEEMYWGIYLPDFID